MATYIGLDLGGTNIKISVFDDFFVWVGSTNLVGAAFFAIFYEQIGIVSCGRTFYFCGIRFDGLFVIIIL